MKLDQHAIADILAEIGTLLELKGENTFKTRAYQNAARTLERIEEPLDKLIAENRLGTIQGIGEAIEKKITELANTGELAYFEELKSSIPSGLVEMLGIPGLGPKKVRALHDKIQVASIAELETACQRGAVAALDGFGDKTQAKILEGIAFRRAYASQHHLSAALAAAEPILDSLRQHPDVIRCSTAGSLRRSKEIIGDIDFLASSNAPAAVIDQFVALPQVMSVNAKGETKASVMLQGGIQADLRVVADAEFSSALAYFTGSKEHNITMRQRAIHRGLRLNEYGLFRSSAETRDPALRVNCQTEEEIHRELDLAYIPPELREDQGEFTAAEGGAIPRLIEWTDLRGSLHNHSNWSDGRDTLQIIAAHVQELGCDYWAITDHSKSSFQANGLDAKRLREQISAVRELNKRLEDEGADCRLLTGTEVDILADGRLDFDDELLAELDVVVASIHQGFTQSEAETTKRLIAAAQNPWVHALGHLTGRLLLQRTPYAVNHAEVIAACAATGTWIELNANPWRFDMDWRHWFAAKSKGVKCVINSDSHQLQHAGYLRLGAGIARKGWLAKEDVINTLPLQALRQELHRKRYRHTG